jgi:hypothetical protein
MHMRTIICFLLAVSGIAAQTDPGNRLTFSGAWSTQVGGYAYAPKEDAAGFGLSYGHRILRFVEAEAGLFTALDPTANVCTKFGCQDLDDRYYWVPFGVRFIAPTYLGRIELSGGGGGLYEKYTVGNSSVCCYAAHDGWGGYFVGSVSVALDRSRRFWLSGTPRWFLANGTYARDRWFQIAGEVSYRFR